MGLKKGMLNFLSVFVLAIAFDDPSILLQTRRFEVMEMSKVESLELRPEAASDWTERSNRFPSASGPGAVASSMSTTLRNESLLELRSSVALTREILQMGPGWRPSAPDSSFRFQRTLRLQTKVYIRGWKPVVGRHACPDGSSVGFVHHLNVFGLYQHEAEVAFGNRTSLWKMPLGSRQQSFVASFDLGSEPYRLPSDVGIAIGPGTRHEVLVLEEHILKPSCWDFEAKAATTDTSGIDLIVTKEKPQHLAIIAGFFDLGLKVAPGNGIVDTVSLLSSDELSPLFDPQRTGHPTIRPEIVAVHLHTHDFARSKHFEIKGPNGSVIFESPEEPAGYGPTQTMRNLKEIGWPRIFLEPGQTLAMHCGYDSDQQTHELQWGVSHGTEMCAPMFVVAGYADELLEVPSALSVRGGATSHRSNSTLPSFFKDAFPLATTILDFR